MDVNDIDDLKREETSKEIELDLKNIEKNTKLIENQTKKQNKILIESLRSGMGDDIKKTIIKRKNKKFKKISNFIKVLVEIISRIF